MKDATNRGEVDCEQCQHFRRARPLTQDILAEVGDHDTGATHLVLQLMQDERARRDAELTAIRDAFRDPEPNREWPAKPEMSDYCGLAGQDEVAYFAEVKNFTRDCPDSAIGKSDHARSCGNCTHRAAPTGRAEDMHSVEELAHLQAEAKIWGSAGDPQAVNELIAHRSARMSLEIGAAYYSRVLTHGPPRYLSHCTRHSRPGHFVPCVVQNRHNACPDWAPTQDLAP